MKRPELLHAPPVVDVPALRRLRRDPRGTIAIWIALLFGYSVIAAAEPRPNVIVILADDLGFNDTGFNGCRDIPTPAIDRIACEGVRFANGYVSHSVCSPTRAGLMTGRYQQRFGYENNFGYLITDPRVGLPREEVTIADILKGAGYATGAIGKWHLGAHPVLHPNRRGFAEFFGFLGGGHDYFSSDRDLDEYSAEILRDGVPDWLKVADPEILSEWQTPVLRNSTAVKFSGYLTTEFGREAVSFVERHRSGPFFLYLSFNAPHTPLQAPSKYVERFSAIANEQRRLCAAMVAAMDDAVGELLDALDRHRLAENTLVFFLSDNGGSVAYNASWNTPFRGTKGDLFEGGIHIPFAFRWPVKLPAGVVYELPVISLDILPTAIAAARVDLPAGLSLDGVDLLPHLTGADKGAPHERLFWRWRARGLFAVREGQYKAVGDAGSGAMLYDLARDPGERHDVARVRPDVLDRLMAAYRTWDADLVEPRWGMGSPRGR
jgi:arylsulfatase A-like enzyme